MLEAAMMFSYDLPHVLVNRAGGKSRTSAVLSRNDWQMSRISDHDVEPDRQRIPL